MYILSSETNLGQGFSNSVHESGDGGVVRKALTREAREALARQFRFLPWLAHRLPVTIPIPEPLTGDALIYPNLPGVPLTPELVNAHGTNRVATQIAEFITALHA